MTGTRLPTYDQFIEPLLRVLAAHPEGIRTQAAYEQVSSHVGLTPEQRLVILPSGRQPTYQNRIGWAHDALKRARLSQSARRGYWCLTPAGAEYVARYPTLSQEQVRELATAYDHRPANAAEEETVGDEVTPAIKDPTASPDDRLNSALAEIRSSVATELLDQVQHNTPEFFEQLVLDAP